MTFPALCPEQKQSLSTEVTRWFCWIIPKTPMWNSSRFGNCSALSLAAIQGQGKQQERQLMVPILSLTWQ